MRTLVALLILLSISFNAQANHNETIEIDKLTTVADKSVLYLDIYNKSSKEISPENYLWKIVFKNGDERVYKSQPYNNVNWCSSYSACTFKIDLGSRTDFKELFPAH